MLWIFLSTSSSLVIQDREKTLPFLKKSLLDFIGLHTFL